MIAGIVLAGGASARMGRDKAALDWHGAPLVAHVSAVVRRGIGGGPVVVVGAPGRALPPLPAWVATTADTATGVGPMQGLLDGLRGLPPGVDEVFLASTDAPLLRPALVETMIEALRSTPAVDAAIPFVRGHRHPLLAAYRASVLDLLAEGIALGQRRAGQILDGRLRLLAETELLASAALRRQDPALASVDDADTPERFAALLASPPPAVTVAGSRRPLGAHRLGDVAEALGRPVGGLRVEGVAWDGGALLPLADGDVVTVAAAS